MKAIVTMALASLLLAGCTAFGIRSGTEAPAYEVVDRRGEAIEIRRYAPRVAVEATVESRDAEDGRNDAFRLLFDYITGANREAAEIAMTTPVETATAPDSAGDDKPGAEIAMTVPVETTEAEPGQMRMRFFLPAAHSAAPPRPLDPRVSIVTLPEQTLAVLRFSGSRSDARIAEKTAELLAALRGTTWRPVGAPVAQLYDPPWTLPFFRRNEVAVAVSR